MADSVAVMDLGALLPRFDELEPGQTLALTADQDLLPALHKLRAERRGIFEWTPLEYGPPRWRVDVFRRAANRGELRSVSEALAWDHDRLDAILGDVFTARQAGRFEAAGRLWPAFEAGLRRHIGFEEEILFPTFDERAGIPAGSGPTAVMRAEHREIQRLLQAIGSAVDAHGRAAEDLRDELLQVLGGHNDKEELVLYPGTDRMLTPEEADALVARIQEFRVRPGA